MNINVTIDWKYSKIEKVIAHFFLPINRILSKIQVFPTFELMLEIMLEMLRFSN